MHTLFGNAGFFNRSQCCHCDSAAAESDIKSDDCTKAINETFGRLKVCFESGTFMTL